MSFCISWVRWIQQILHILSIDSSVPSQLYSPYATMRVLHKATHHGQLCVSYTAYLKSMTFDL